MTVHSPTGSGVISRPKVIGVGNRCRCDDGAGFAVIERIRARRPHLCVVEASGEGASLMELWKPGDEVVLVDAVRSGSAPGRIHRLDALRERIPSGFFHYSTHAFSVAEAIEMARALDLLPSRLIVYGIEGANFSAGTEMSPDVTNAVETLVDRILAEFEDQANTVIESTEVSHA
ncbi:MAG: hydrogenase maturation protease [Phycisphaerales bacterium]|nr:hydrogenase maturation protease [Phycisphaerales bacterium]